MQNKTYKIEEIVQLSKDNKIACINAGISCNKSVIPREASIIVLHSQYYSPTLPNIIVLHSQYQYIQFIIIFFWQTYRCWLITYSI